MAFDTARLRSFVSSKNAQLQRLTVRREDCSGESPRSALGGTSTGGIAEAVSTLSIKSKTTGSDTGIPVKIPLSSNPPFPSCKDTDTVVFGAKPSSSESEGVPRSTI